MIERKVTHDANHAFRRQGIGRGREVFRFGLRSFAFSFELDGVFRGIERLDFTPDDAAAHVFGDLFETQGTKDAIGSPERLDGPGNRFGKTAVLTAAGFGEMDSRQTIVSCRFHRPLRGPTLKFASAGYLNTALFSGNDIGGRNGFRSGKKQKDE
jgi:hypothetical protein